MRRSPLAEYMNAQSAIINIDYATWDNATFIFRIIEIPPTTAQNSCNILKFNNNISGRGANGFQCVAFGSKADNMQFAIQTPKSGILPATTSATIKLKPIVWYMLVISKNAKTLTLYSINIPINKSDLSAPRLANTLKQEGVIPLPPFNMLPTKKDVSHYIQIADGRSSMMMQVASLCLYDPSVPSVDANAEINGFPTGVF
jgi:hypothetical protein